MRAYSDELEMNLDGDKQRSFCISCYSPNDVERQSERGRRSLQRSVTDHPKILFALRTPAISTFGALLVHLFGLSLEGKFSEVRMLSVLRSSA
jgi:hypothetical protein